MQSEYHEEGLIRAAQKGDRDAFARLYEVHAERVYRYLVRRLGNPADAEDVTAEVFVRAMRAFSGYQLNDLFYFAPEGQVMTLPRRTPLTQKSYL